MSKIKETKNTKQNEYKLKQKYIKYPFSGVASNLIDKFLVLGYEQQDIDKTLFDDEPKKLNINNNFLKYVNFQERPSVINEVCSNYKKESQDNDVIIQIIFPNFPQLIFIEKNNDSENKDKEKLDRYEELESKLIIFSLNPQDNNGNKKSFNGFGYTFYSRKEHRNEVGEIDKILYYPITFVILSDFPYYLQFHKICKNVHDQMMKKTDEIPIDIILYNAIKYCPSPINVNLNLTFGMKLYGNNKKITRDDILNQLFSIKGTESVNDIPNLFLNQLSGYPLMDLNLSFLFSLLEPRMVILTFILTFLEYDIIFFSVEPEILNIVMYIFNNFNYPFNDSIYYWHVVSLSKKDFMSDNGSPFIGKASSSMMGICCEYDQNINTTKKVKDHFVLNIDDKTLSYSCDEGATDEGGNNKILELYEYLNDCIPDIEYKESQDNVDELNIKNKYNDGLNLYSSLRKLANTLNRRARIVTKTNYNEKKYRPSFFVPYEVESEMDMMIENLQIQKAFYTFIIQIISAYIIEYNIETYLIDDIKLNTNKLDKKFPIMMNIKKKENQEDLTGNEKSLAFRAGLTFKKLFKESSKYSTFLTNFCQYHDCLTAVKIPYSFFYEYLYFSKVSPDFSLSSIDMLLIIDQFYGKIKKLDFIELIKEKQEEEIIDDDNIIESITKDKNKLINFNSIYNFSYDEFELLYKEQLRAHINREQEDDKYIFIKEQTSNKQLKIYKRNNFYLSQKILDIYINFSNNNYEELQKCFKLIECENKINEKPNEQLIDNKNKKTNKKGKDNIIIEPKKEEVKNNKNITEANNKISATYELMEISDLIEKHLIMEKYFSAYEIMKFSLLNIIAITMGMQKKLINTVLVIKILCDFCNITNSLVRKYMNIYLLIFTHMKLNKELDKQQCDDCIKLIISYFKKTNTFPTEDTNISILLSEAYNSNDDVKVDYKSLESFKKCKKPDREKRAEFYTKNSKINEEELIDYIEKVFAGWYYINKNKLAPNIKYYAKKYSNLYSALKINKSGEFVPKTPLELYASTNKLLFEFLSNFHLDENKYGELGVIILSLLYYFKMDFFLPKWNFKGKNVKIDRNSKNVGNNNIGNNEQIKKLVVDIIYILLDLYEVIVAHVQK